MASGVLAPAYPAPAIEDLPTVAPYEVVAQAYAYDGENVLWWKMTFAEEGYWCWDYTSTTHPDGTKEDGDYFVASPIGTGDVQLVSGTLELALTENVGSRAKMFYKVGANTTVRFYAVGADLRNGFGPVIIGLTVQPYAVVQGAWDREPGEQVITINCTPGPYRNTSLYPGWTATTPEVPKQGGSIVNGLIDMSYYYTATGSVPTSGCTWNALNTFGTQASTDPTPWPSSGQVPFSAEDVYQCAWMHGTRDRSLAYIPTAQWNPCPALVKSTTKLQSYAYQGYIGWHAEYRDPAEWPEVNQYSYRVDGSYQAFGFRPDQAQFADVINLDYSAMFATTPALFDEWDMEDRTITKIEVKADTFGPNKPWGNNGSPGDRSTQVKIGWYVGVTKSLDDTDWGLTEADLIGTPFFDETTAPYYSPQHMSFVVGPAGPPAIVANDVRISGLQGAELADSAWRTVPDALLQAAYARGEGVSSTTVLTGLRFTALEESVLDAATIDQVHGNGWEAKRSDFPGGGTDSNGNPIPEGARPLNQPGGSGYLLVRERSSRISRRYNGLSMRFTVRHRRRRTGEFMLIPQPTTEIIGETDLSRRRFT